MISNHSGWKGIFLKTALLALVPALLGISVNAVRPDPLAWRAKAPYEIYSECRELSGAAGTITAAEILRDPGTALLVDVRPADRYALGHIRGAVSSPYDSLYPVRPEEVERLEALSHGRTVVFVGEGGSAKQAAGDFQAAGLAKVRHLDPGEDWRELSGATGGE